MTLKTIIIDDEPFVRKDISNMLLSYKKVVVTSQAGSLAEARKKLSQNRFDLVFLDICLSGGTGFDLIPFINPSAKIVFITGHDEYAIRAFEVNALDYLLKPVCPDRLDKTLMRLEPEIKSPVSRNFDHRVLVNLNSGYQFVSPDEIIVISSIGGNYICVHLKNNEQLVCRKTLSEWESLLPESCFFRIHRSTIINMKYIKSMLHEKDGSFHIFLFNRDKSFTVSRRMVSSLKTKIKKMTSEQ
ncbi:MULTISPECIES: LytR/AlgR family response regulator transcription factor [Desulfobacula]|uniref:LytT: two component system response regulator, LytT family n=2 Tax=Desulfobacula TaxID=28222 RepID=K0NPK6_DESTT|nr:MULTISPECIES: LytTR family DNA-binding domain-containing protein [Desulfobacula]CCK80802.1 LytT: two component system response regulator, LytT family [Desulfobacula toluolica Tol2]SDU58190.1 two component transcriptional regulator, LytTR family [Desulfobacula phenolica]